MFPRSVLGRFHRRITTVVGITWKVDSSRKGNALPSGEPLVGLPAIQERERINTVIACLDLLADGETVPV